MSNTKQEFLKSAVLYELCIRNHTEEGTIRKASEDLNRLKQLGVDIIYLMPVHPVSCTNRKGSEGSPYAISDYRAVHPDFGTEEDLGDFFGKAHSLGLKVIMDVVYNHMGRDSVLLKEHPEWFLRDAEGNPTLKFTDWSDVYDLDYSVPDLWDYLIGSLDKWASLGADEFRCDVAPMVPLEFWKTARRTLHAKFDLIWLAESVQPGFIKYLRDRGYHGHSDAELHRAFDLTYDYDGRACLERYWGGRGSLAEYIRYIDIQENMYPADAVKMRFLENHDQVRISDIITNAVSRKNWYVFTMLLPGAFLVWDGEESGLTKNVPLFEKEKIKWEEGDESFKPFFAQMLGLSKRIKRTCRQFSMEEIGTGIVRLEWSGDGKSYTAIVNLEDKYGDIPVPGTIRGRELLSGSDVRIDHTLRISKEPLLISHAKETK